MYVARPLPNESSRPDRAIVILGSILTTAGVIAMQLADSGSGRSELFMLVMPIALLAIGFGLRGGIIGAALAITTFMAWSLATDADLSFFKVVARPVTFITVGVVVGLAFDSMARMHSMVRAIVDGTSDAIYAKDRAGRYVMANDGAVRLFGVDHSKVMGHTDSELMPREAAESIRQDDVLVMEKGTSFSTEETFPFPDGKWRILLTKKGPMRDNGGRVIGVFGISRDVTETRRLEKFELEAAVHERTEFERARREYSQLVRHRLMNPLTVIRGNAHTLRRLTIDQEMHEQLCDLIIEATQQIERASLEPDASRAEEHGIDPVPHVIDTPQ